MSGEWILFIFLWIQCSFSSFFHPLASHTLNPSTFFMPSNLHSSLPLSCLDHSDYRESSGSASAEDEYLPSRQRSPKVGMTRLDPRPHRPDPRAWMEEAQSGAGFSGRSGIRSLTLRPLLFLTHHKMSQSMKYINRWILKGRVGKCTRAIRIQLQLQVFFTW